MSIDHSHLFSFPMNNYLGVHLPFLCLGRYWKENLRELDYDELVYGHDRLSEIAEKHPRCTSGIIRFLYIIILKRMEIRDGSRSVNSVDIMFNFDIIGFTGTPFLDNCE